MDEQPKGSNPTVTVATKDSVYLCPTCQSPYLEKSALTGGTAKCLACAWAGQADQLIEQEISHQFAGKDEIMVVFLRELSTMLAQTTAKPLGDMLVKWGFLQQPVKTETLVRYMRRISFAVGKAVIEERQAQEAERVAKAKLRTMS